MTTIAPVEPASQFFGDPTSTKMEMPVIQRWFADKGDQTLRLDYPLTRDSVVLDVGGYEGNWAAQIASRYDCTVHIFEPVPQFARNIRDRFAGQPNIYVHNFGISDKTTQSTIYLNNDGTSVHKTGGNACPIELVSAAEAFRRLELPPVISLMKVNIEGSEYELLPHLMDTALVTQVQDIQVQFHDFIPKAATRMRSIHESLARTHAMTWQYRFVWENWRLRA